MPKNRVSITVHFVEGEDDDLIGLLNTVRGSERAALVKSRLRQEKYTPQKEGIDYRPAIDDLLGRVHWMQENLYALPQTLESLISRFAISGSPLSIPPESAIDQQRASKEALERRKEKTKKNGW